MIEISVQIIVLTIVILAGMALIARYKGPRK